MRRVPVPYVILLAATAIAVPWWHGTKDLDFMTPPSDQRLAHIRYRTAASFPKRESFPVESEDERNRAFQSPIKAAPVIDPGNPHAPAGIDEFREHAGKGAAALVELAVHLEEQSGHARALLAWERVLDVCQPDQAQRTAALAGIQRLRPLVAPWNIDPQAAIPLVLEASVPKDAPAEGMDDLMDACADVLGRKSSGLVDFTARLARPERTGDDAPRMSLQILAEGESSASTGLIDIPLPDDTAQLRREVFAGAYKLVASQLAASTDFTPPDPPDDGEDPAAALGIRITRLGWQEFGKSLLPSDRP